MGCCTSTSDAPRDVDRISVPHTRGVVLCGPPKPELRGALTGSLLERLVGALRRRYAYVVLDTGPDLLGAEGALNRTALALADRVVLVCGPDVVSLWRARTALGLLREHVGLDAARLSVVVNRHDDRFHHGRAEIEETLGLRLAGPGRAAPPPRVGGVRRPFQRCPATPGHRSTQAAVGRQDRIVATGRDGRVVAVPVLGGLHHEYRSAA